MTQVANGGSGGARKGLLRSLRVLDLTDEVAVNGARLLAALGADVVRPEPGEGDPLRMRYPVVARADGRGELSLAHVTYNAGKRSVVVPPGEAGYADLARLADAADVVIVSEGSPYFGFVEASEEDFTERHPGCALVVVRHFAEDSEFRGWQTTDLIINATSGFSWFCGAADGVPEHPKGQLAYSYIGASSAMAAMFGVVSRDRQGAAGRYSLAAQEAFAFSTCQSADPNQYRWHNTIPGRLMWTGTQRRALHICGDGTPCTFVMQGPHWEKLAEWFSEVGMGESFLSEDWLERGYFIEHQAKMIEAIDRLCQLHERDDLVRRGQSMRLMVMPVNSALDMLADPQLRDRGMFIETETQVGTLEMLRAPLASSERDVLPAPSRPPEIGEHGDEVLADWGARKQPTSPEANAGNGKLPLDGIRVADFSWMLAGPLATRFLADMGADVVRIESHTRRDAVREIGPQPPGTYTLDTNSTYHQGGCNKRSIALDMHFPEAVAVAREIIAKSDIVFDNFAPGAMGRWGLDADSLLAEWPHLVVVSQPAVGSSGPHGHWGAIGNGVAGYAGLNAITGFPENPPWGLGPIVADQVAPLFTVTAILAALHERERTGCGQYIDCGMLESNTWALDATLLEAQVRGENPPRTGNRSGWMAPHGIFPCAGEDEWVAIAVRSDEEWARCAKALRIADADSRFATFKGRKECEDELERLIAGATSGHDRWELARALQEAGVPAAPLLNIADHLERDRSMARCFTPTPHPHGFEFLVRDQFVKVNGATVPNRRAPLLGEQSDDILRVLLGKSDEAIAELIAAGALS